MLPYRKKGMTIVESILVVLCIMFFIIGGLLMKFDRSLIVLRIDKGNIITSPVKVTQSSIEKTINLPLNHATLKKNENVKK